MKILNNNFFLRFALAVIFLAHSLPSIFTGSVNQFGTAYLDKVGFAPFGLYLAWAVKLSHIAAAACLLLNRYLRPAGVVTIAILIFGIFMVHLPDGWFVVGGGRNGVEFNFLLIFAWLGLMFPGQEKN
jgi:putative oxidoreductase